LGVVWWKDADHNVSFKLVGVECSDGAADALDCNTQRAEARDTVAWVVVGTCVCVALGTAPWLVRRLHYSESWELAETAVQVLTLCYMAYGISAIHTLREVLYIVVEKNTRVYATEASASTGYTLYSMAAVFLLLSIVSYAFYWKMSTARLERPGSQVV